jgi:hypothetical protein
MQEYGLILTLTAGLSGALLLGVLAGAMLFGDRG